MLAGWAVFPTSPNADVLGVESGNGSGTLVIPSLFERATTAIDFSLVSTRRNSVDDVTFLLDVVLVVTVEAESIKAS